MRSAAAAADSPNRFRFQTDNPTAAATQSTLCTGNTDIFLDQLQIKPGLVGWEQSENWRVTSSVQRPCGPRDEGGKHLEATLGKLY